MRLKSLELFGFKSFVDRTVICFEAGVNAIVGPNGCGKTNCVDAIRWVMGEQSAKHLRGQEMQDVIFGGTAGRPAVGMAHVVLTFDTSDGRAPQGFGDYPEIQVERRLYRSGESEYAINKVPCRLRDVIDLFLGTGIGTKAYSIIEQGQVERIIASKPQERRLVIEEAAGISKFKNRKEAALRRIEATETNIARLDDIIGELKRQLASLDRQARKAERYRKLFETLKEKELRGAAIAGGRFRTEIGGLESEGTELERRETDLGVRLADLETRAQTERLESARLEQDLNQTQEKFYTAQNAVKLHEASLDYQGRQIRDIAERMERNMREIAAFRDKLKQADESLEALNRDQVLLDLGLVEGDEKAALLEKEYQAALVFHREWEERTETLQREILSAVSSVAEAQSRLEYLEKNELEAEGRIAKGQSEIDGIDRKIRELEKDIRGADKTLESLSQLKLSLVDRSGAAKKELTGKKREMEFAQTRLQNLKADAVHKESRLAALKNIGETREGYKEGVRAVLNTSLQGVRGSVGELMDTEPSFEPAVNAVLGEKLQYVVVASREAGVEAIDYLKTLARGRSSFIPLDIRAASEQPMDRSGEGVIAPLMEKVRFHDDYRGVARHLFGDCLLVEDLRKALRIWQDGGFGKTLVTLEGEVVSADGVLSGGNLLGEESLLGLRRRIAGIEAELAVARELAEAAEKEVERVRKEIRGLEEQGETLSRGTHEEEIKKINQERDGSRLREELRRLHADRDRLTMEIARALDEKKEVGLEKEAIAKKRAQGQSDRQGLEEKLAEARTRLTRTVRTKEEMAEALFKARSEMAQMKERVEGTQKECRQWMETRIELQQGIETRMAEIGAGQQQARELTEKQGEERALLEQSLKDVEEFGSQQTRLKTAYEQFAEAMRDKEGEIRTLRKQHDESLKLRHQNALALAEARNRLKALADQILERYKADLQQVPVPESPMSEEDEAREAEAIARLREQMEKIGSVHVGAIEEYDELKERFEFLSKQREDLGCSLEGLKKAIHKINRVSRERFLKTFELVDAKFQEVFPRLFKGGRAKLVLVDPGKSDGESVREAPGESGIVPVLEMGVEIAAQPPGKKLQSISLLSGGEKALTATALIFSIFLIKPSPFCLLDEVDAPLDDANIDRFNDLVREMTEKSQFLIITHNKRTMEKADCLYGVTMEEAGVSKVVSVQLSAST